MNIETTFSVTSYVLLITFLISFILSLYIHKFKKKGTKRSKLLLKQNKGSLFNWMKIHLNEKGVKIVKWMNIFYLILIFEIILFVIQILIILFKVM